MNVVKCMNGHFFDADKYELCPHCGAAMIGGGATSDSAAQKKQHQPFWKKKEEVSNVSERVVSEKTMGKTFGVFDQQVVTPVKSEIEIQENNYVPYIPNIPDNGDVFKPTPVSERKEEVVESVDIPEEAAAPKEQSLKSAVKNVAATNQGKTVGFFSSGRAESTSESASDMSCEPVVGWLVCVKGKHFGECFNIEAGRNALGRGETNKIVLSKDSSISREKHAWITYEPKRREFFIQPGESSGLSYLNDDTLMEARKLKEYDKLEFGNSAFLLIPLCGDNFSWEDYMNGAE